MLRVAGNGILQQLEWLMHHDEPLNKKKENIAIIGYGWAGKTLYENLDKHKFDVKVYEKNDYFLHSENLKFVLDNHKPIIEKHQLKKEEATYINYLNKSVNLQNFDKIIIASGSTNNFYNIPGVNENCYFLKTYDDYIRLQEKLKSLNENDEIIIIGGGATGIELGSNLSKKFKNIKIIEARDILTNFSQATKDYIKKNHNYLNLCINHQVVKVDKIPIVENDVYEVTIKDNNNNNKYLESKIVIYVAGIQAIHKNILSDNKNIFAIGDCNNNGPLSAQKAKQEGVHLANCLNKNNYTDFKYTDNGKLLHLKNEIIYDKNNSSYILPKFFEYIIDLFI